MIHDKVKAVRVNRRQDDGTAERGVFWEFTDSATAADREAIRDYNVDTGQPIAPQIDDALGQS